MCRKGFDDAHFIDNNKRGIKFLLLRNRPLRSTGLKTCVTDLASAVPGFNSSREPLGHNEI